MEIIAESLAESRKKGQRTAAEQDRSLEADAVRKRYHRLYGDGMEDAGCNICFGQIACHQVLDVGLGEHGAASVSARPDARRASCSAARRPRAAPA